MDNPTAVTIKCVWWGDPKPTLSIIKNDTALPSGDVEVQEPTGKNMLSYLTATVITDGDEDFGTYTCHASNYIGSANYSVDINKPGQWSTSSELQKCPDGTSQAVTVN